MNRKTNTHRLLHKLLNALSHAIDDIGYASTIQALNNVRTNRNANQEDFNICVNAVCQTFQISKSELLQGTQKKYPRKYAFGILVYLAKTEYKYSLAELGRLLNKDRSNLSRIKKEMGENLTNHSNKFDSFIIGKYQTCLEAIQKIKQQHDTDGK
jgi:chromosomal replication initiation ATPase DnaA